MKKYLALLLALMLLLTACGQSAEQSPDQTSAENADSAAGELYVDEFESEDGQAKFKDYYEGGKDGRLVRSECYMADGSYSEILYTEGGAPDHSIFRGADGSVYEDFYYPNGTLSKSIITNADGSWMEFHYADNGVVDNETMTYYSGTTIYQKEVAADGTVVYEMETELRYEEDGTYWTVDTYDDGSVREAHYTADGILMADKHTDPANGMNSETEYAEDGTMLRSIYDDTENGIRTETEYYSNGNPMTMTVTRTDSYSTVEYYENGYLKHEYYEHEDGTVSEDKLNEAGYLVYSHIISSGYDTEHFADEEGVLVKYVENGTVYEGSAIPSWAAENFAGMQENTQYRHIQSYSE